VAESGFAGEKGVPAKRSVPENRIRMVKKSCFIVSFRLKV